MNWLKENEFLATWIVLPLSIIALIFSKDDIVIFIEGLKMDWFRMFIVLPIFVLGIIMLIVSIRRKRKEKKEMTEKLQQINPTEMWKILDRNSAMIEALLNQKQDHELRIRKLEKQKEAI